MNRVAKLGVGLAIRLLPRRMRARYREEWHADLAGAGEAGLPAWSVTLGALLFSATLDRSAPELTGLSIAATARRRARWGIAFLGSAAVFSFGSLVLSGANASLALGLASATLTVLACGFAVVGLGQLWRAALAVNTLALVTAALATAGTLCLVAGWPASGRGSFLLLAGIVLLFAAAVCGAIVAGSAAPSDAAMPAVAARSSRGAVRSLVIATVLLLSLLAVGGLELLVWGPLAQTESLTLAEVYASLSAGDRTQGVALILGWLVFWSIAIIAFVCTIAFRLRGSRRPRRTTIWSAALAIAAAMVFFQFWAGFSLGMSIADTLPPYSGRISPVGYAYALTGQLALVATIFLVIAPRRTSVGPAGIEPTTSTV